MRRVVITHALRTPIGRFLGALKDVSSVDLGTAVIRGLLAQSNVTPSAISEVIFGNARQAGGGPNPARQVAIKAGLGHATTALTVNMACASGLKSIALAAQDISLGEHDIAIAGGTESMSRLPYLLPRARDGYRLGEAPIVDAMFQDGFQCPLAEQLMGETAENLAEEFSISREEQDRFAVDSQRKCEAARSRGDFVEEILPFVIRGKNGATELRLDEHPRDGSTLQGMSKLPAVFKKDGTVHAGNSSGITDGAAAVLLMTEDEARRRGFEVLSFIEGFAAAGVDPKRMGIGPIPATARLMSQLNLTLSDFDLIELNEAFAAQVLACMRQWGIGTERINVNGGAIALGHPIGATGARIVVTLLHAMKRRQVRRGLATLCVSGGMGVSMSFLRP